MLTKNLLLLKSYTSLDAVDSTSGTVGVRCYFLPHDWLETNNPFHNELKEGENKWPLSQAHFLSFS